MTDTKRLLFPFIAILLLTAGCFYITNPFPSGNQETTDTTTGQAPTAYIDSITPTTPQQGEAIILAGHGTDPDGSIMAYKWRSSISGDLSNQANFQTSSLTPGTHTIYLSVQDNQGNWSNEASSTITISSAQTTTLPIINTFYADPGTIQIGNPTTLNWNVANATSITIDHGIGSVSSVGSIAVTPPGSTVYTLTAMNSRGVMTATAQITVKASLSHEIPIINSFFANPSTLHPGESTTLSWSVLNAQSVMVDQGIGIVGANDTRTVTPVTTTSYMLSAINPAAVMYQTITVVVLSQ